MKKYSLAFLVALILVSNCESQTGGSYDLSHNVVASGGGSNSVGGGYAVDGTIGQPIAGVQSSGAALSVRGGFWGFQSFAPTAAGTSISGRVVTVKGDGITNARLMLTNLATGEVHATLTSAFGYYRFDDVPVGAMYSVSISSKAHNYDPPILFINVVDEITDVNFTGTPVN